MNALNSGYQVQGNTVATMATVTIDVRCAVAYQTVLAQIARAADAACNFDTPWLVEGPWVR